MHEFAQTAVRTETGQIVGAEHPANVPMTTVRSVSTEAAIVPRTVANLRFRIDVQERAFLIVAGIEARIEVAFGHFGHVVFVQELALVALLAEATQPMFADNRTIAANVPKRTGGTLFAFLTRIGAIEELTDSGRGLCG